MESFFQVATFLTELYICWILTVEFFYDKKVYESKRRKLKRTKNKVVVQVENGQATISEQPKDVEVVIENK
jgi:hypothetical protein